MTFAADKFRKFLPAAMFAMVVEFVMGPAGKAQYDDTGFNRNCFKI